MCDFWIIYEPSYQWVALSTSGQFLWVQWLWCVWEFHPVKRHLLGCQTLAVPFRKEETRGPGSFNSFKLKIFNITYVHYWLNNIENAKQYILSLFSRSWKIGQFFNFLRTETVYTALHFLCYLTNNVHMLYWKFLIWMNWMNQGPLFLLS